MWLSLEQGPLLLTKHYNDVIMSTMASQITSLAIVYSTVYWDVDQRKHQSSASLAFVRGIHRWPVNSPHKGPVTRKIFPFDHVITVYLRIGHEQMITTIALMWCDYSSMLLLERWFNSITVEVRTFVYDYTKEFWVDVIAYPCPKAIAHSTMHIKVTSW